MFKKIITSITITIMIISVIGSTSALTLDIRETGNNVLTVDVHGYHFGYNINGNSRFYDYDIFKIPANGRVIKAYTYAQLGPNGEDFDCIKFFGKSCLIKTLTFDKTYFDKDVTFKLAVHARAKAGATTQYSFDDVVNTQTGEHIDYEFASVKNNHEWTDNIKKPLNIKVISQ